MVVERDFHDLFAAFEWAIYFIVKTVLNMLKRFFIFHTMKVVGLVHFNMDLAPDMIVLAHKSFLVKSLFDKPMYIGKIRI